MLLNGAALPFPQFALLRLVTCVQLRLITILGNCEGVAVASFLGVPSPLEIFDTVSHLCLGERVRLFRLMFVTRGWRSMALK
jgi:hypothetical protein